ncbi:MAG: hypothetical protein A3C02_02655 [Candidatus Andersenbacteria bacterium RIFCSPHIGHO2_02_FULL_45_11]|uniref:Glycosyltransferase RgtA/B/C/D-like domain-containing protein n=1 Tax=Candidatus Andersenbacteria bacterium RIFCSPHIGHO2_12_FULL_45_11 TaxID=1797281 RepID=A0A1G1X6R1_9BACT|nr:MAG: hypothetical protein A3C02_02655 [Candidatus Andersenbacteria bacterium RIFCSPHIGHO2_02_FULL_45_11]OGY35270.1 MAG: hypothetical protein A3D99_01215 [Candidatus Andersenbacteria bacterium RIFCSPHIGHO2_12_FULL_45_11]
MKPGWLKAGIAVAAVTILAFVLRTYDLTNYPPGLFPDEAQNGEDALDILQGDIRPFYERNNGREGLFFFFQAALIKTFGVGVWQMHLASAIIGTLTVLAIYFATQVFFGRLAGLLASLFLTTSSWHLTLSRTGFRAILIPLFLSLFTACAGLTISAVKEKRIRASYIYAALAGIFFSGGFYTYIAYRAMIGVVLGVFVLLLLAAMHPKIGFPHVRRYGKQTLVALLAALIAIAPLVLYFIQHPNEFIGRASQVSIFSPDLQREVGGGTLVGTLLYSTNKTILSFFSRGDENWRHNVAGYSLLNPFVGFLFVLGILWTMKGTWDVFRRIVKGKEVHLGMMYPYILLMLLGMMLPTITTAEGMPHALRSIGMAAPIYILAGTAGAVALRWSFKWGYKRHVLGMVYGAAAGLLIVSSAYGPMLYFIISRNTPEAAEAYRGDLTVVSDFIHQHTAKFPNGPKPYLVVDEFFSKTVHFLAHGNTYQLLEPGASERTVLQIGEQIIFTQSTIPDADRYERVYGASVKQIVSKLNRFGQEVIRVYEGVGNAPTPEELEVDLDA